MIRQRNRPKERLERLVEAAMWMKLLSPRAKGEPGELIQHLPESERAELKKLTEQRCFGPSVAAD